MGIEITPDQVEQTKSKLGLPDIESTKKARKVLNAVPLNDVMCGEIPSIRHVIDPICPARVVTLLGGHGGIGKSNLALAVSAHVACGKPFASFPVEREVALFVSMEDEPDIVRARLRQIIKAYGLPTDQVIENLRLVDGSSGNAALFKEDAPNGLPVFTSVFRELVEHSEGAGFIVIDNASDAFDSNENSRRSVRTFVRGLVSLARQYDAAVVLLAHIDKNAARLGGNGNNYSGSTAWHNSTRSRLALVEQDGVISLVHEKANLSRKADPVLISFIDGVPMPESGPTALAGTNSASVDKAEIIRALNAADEAGISVPSNLNPGAHSAMKALESLPEYERAFKGRVGSKRASTAIATLIREGRVMRSSYRKPNRHMGERLVLAEHEKVRCVTPYNPQRIDAAHGDACANAPKGNGAVASTTDAVSAKPWGEEI